MIETQETINQWQLETFNCASPLRIAVRANVEMAELLHELIQPDNDQSIGLECADITIMMMGICGALGISLQDQIDYKMAINRKREWAVTPDGRVQHVSEG